MRSLQAARLKFCVCWLHLLAVLQCYLVSSVCAQPSPEREPASLQSSGADSLPGVYEVPLALQRQQWATARAGFGYGWTEAVLKQNDRHHRLQLDAAASVSPTPWLSGWLRLLGRYDLHTGEPSQSDYGILTETHFGGRVSVPLSRELHAGTELALWAPAGDSVGRALAAISGDLQLLMTYTPSQLPLSVGVALGLRADRTRAATTQSEQYSLSDRLALGASDTTWAMRQGVALAYRTGALEWLFEWSFRMYFAHISSSPMWVRAGARYLLSDRLQLELLLGVSPSKRPALTESAQFWAVEPRAWAGVAVTYAFTTAPGPARPPVTQPAPPAPPTPTTPPPPPPPASVHGQVLAPAGAGIADAVLTLQHADGAVEQRADELGRYSFAPVAPGSYTLGVTAPGWKPAQEQLELAAGDTRELNISLLRDVPQGQIRGTVRRFNGQPIVATVTIAELSVEQKTHEDGTFEVDVPPGRYTVAVTASGFRQQSRAAQVELHGVAILIVELEPVR